MIAGLANVATRVRAATWVGKAAYVGYSAGLTYEVASTGIQLYTGGQKLADGNLWGLVDVGLGIVPAVGLKNALKFRTPKFAGSRVTPPTRAATHLDDAELVAQRALTRLQGQIPGGHFLSRHSPLVSRTQLYRRATTGITPEGVQSYTTNSTRFFRYSDMQEAIDKAVRSYWAGGYTGRMRITIDLRRTVGEGFYHNTGIYGTTNKVIVGVTMYGQPYTAFPLLP